MTTELSFEGRMDLRTVWAGGHSPRHRGESERTWPVQRTAVRLGHLEHEGEGQE